MNISKKVLFILSVFFVLIVSFFIFKNLTPVKIETQHIGNQVKIISKYMPVTKRYLYFEYSGFPKDIHTKVYFEDSNGQKYDLTKKLTESGSKWYIQIIRIPDSLQGKVHLVAISDKTYKDGWIKIKKLHQALWKESFSFTAYGITLFCIVLFGFIISSLYGHFLNYSDDKVQAFISVSLMIGITSFVIFNVYLINYRLGKLLSILFLIYVTLKFFQIKKQYYKETLNMFLLVSSLVLIVIFITYSGGYINGIKMQHLAANKWLHLPMDNWIPVLFANSVLADQIPNWPLAPNWLTSDRPPLQTGFYLMFTMFGVSEIVYQIMSMGLQVLVFIFLFLMVQKIIQERLYSILVISIIFFSGFSFINVLFVWPKLFSALYQAIALYCVYLVWTQQVTNKKIYKIYGASSALALLAHGGALFFLLPLSFLLLVKSLKRKIELLSGIVTALIIYAPWLYYQKVIDPNKGRLIKEHLAGYIGLGKDISAKEALYEYYSSLTLSKWLEIRLEHLKLVFDNIYIHLNEIFSFTNGAWKTNIFVHLDFSYLFFSSLFVLLIFFIKTKSIDEKQYLKVLFWSFILYIVFWTTILSSRTLVHHGSYFGLLDGLLLTTLIVYRLHKYLFILLASLNIFIFFKVYIVESLTNGYIIANSFFAIGVGIFYYALFHMVQDTKKQVYSG